MYKKFFIFLLITLMIFNNFISIKAQKTINDIAQESGYSIDKRYTPRSSLVIDADTGEILWEDNSTQIEHIASITKLMTAYLTLDAIKTGQISEDTLVSATTSHQTISTLPELSNTTIIANQQYTIRDLLLMTLVSSSNVASLMLAEAVSNDLTTFIEKMNEKAKSLNLTQTLFTDPSGASLSSYTQVIDITSKHLNTESSSTAQDLAKLVYHLLNDHPNIIEYTKQISITVGNNTNHPESLNATNASLEGAIYGVKGVNGLKTGSSPDANFNYIATSNRNGFRLIEVILNAGDYNNYDTVIYRHFFGNALLEYIYQNYEKKVILNKGIHTINGQNVKINDELIGVVKKNSEPQLEIIDQRVIFKSPLNNLFKRKDNSVAAFSPQSSNNVVTSNNITDYLTLFIGCSLLVVGLLLLKKLTRKK